MINKSNYEAFALDYLEGNLSATDRQAMEDFLAKHPTIAEEVMMLADMVTIVPDESIVFENKAALLKQEDSAKVVAMYRRTWFRVAVAAAAMLLLVGGYLAGYFTEDAGMKDNFVINNTPKKETNEATNIKPLEEENEEVIVVDEEMIEETEVVLNNKIQEKKALKKAITPQSKSTQRYSDVANTPLPNTKNTTIEKPESNMPELQEITPEKEDESVIVVNENEPIVPEEVPQTKLSPQEDVTTPTPKKEAVATNEKPQNETIIENEAEVVQPIASIENTNNQNTMEEEKKGKKTLRKIGRFFGKLPFEGATASIIPTYYTDKKKDSK
jgi:hypothetical protein